MEVGTVCNISKIIVGVDIGTDRADKSTGRAVFGDIADGADVCNIAGRVNVSKIFRPYTVKLAGIGLYLCSGITTKLQAKFLPQIGT